MILAYLLALLHELAWHARNARRLARAWGENMRAAIPDTTEADW